MIFGLSEEDDIKLGSVGENWEKIYKKPMETTKDGILFFYFTSQNPNKVAKGSSVLTQGPLWLTCYIWTGYYVKLKYNKIYRYKYKYTITCKNIVLYCIVIFSDQFQFTLFNIKFVDGGGASIIHFQLDSRHSYLVYRSSTASLTLQCLCCVNCNVT